ncbi:MAG: cytochrome c maturation protein CcmE [Gammaproteobacteria bacterium]|nr:cytochrome c maturation protein CcmE [Gammaproteobacteria bacterium]
MTPTRKKRLILVSLMVVGVAVAAGLTLNAFRQNILFFFTPSQIAAGDAPTGHDFRIGGMVVENSMKRAEGSLTVEFGVTDTANTVPVVYTGILPDLFREGQGIVAKGKLDGSGVFVASEVLAKHDENYMPPEVADALQAARTLKQE